MKTETYSNAHKQDRQSNRQRHMLYEGLQNKKELDVGMHTYIVLNAVRGRSNMTLKRINTNKDQEKTFYLNKY